MSLKCFLKRLYQFTAIYNNVSFSAILPAINIIWIFKLSQSDKYKVISHCYFTLHFLSYSWDLALFVCFLSIQTCSFMNYFVKSFVHFFPKGYQFPSWRFAGIPLILKILTVCSLYFIFPQICCLLYKFI